MNLQAHETRVSPVVIRWRGDDVETTHFASATLFDPERGAIDLLPQSHKMRVWLRSSAKPFQAVNLLAHPNAQTLLPQEWAIIGASHGGMPVHLQWVQSVLQKAGASVEDLQCGCHLPIDEEAMRLLLASGQVESPLHHNCSGKHAGMVLACTWHGWDKVSYLSPNHPIQQHILEALAQVVDRSRIHVGVDGCGVPVFGMPLADGAALYAHLAQNPLYAPMVRAMTAYPQLVGDPGRIDTHLMKASDGTILAKVGAEGLIGLAHLPSQRGLMIKVHDGLNAARDRLCLAILQKLGWLSPQALEDLWAKPQFSTLCTNGRGDVTGRYTFDLEWLDALTKHGPHPLGG